MKHVPYTLCNLYNQSNDRFCGMLLFSEHWNCIMILPIHYVKRNAFWKVIIGSTLYAKPSVTKYNIQSAVLQSRLIFTIFIMKVYFLYFYSYFVLWCWQRIEIHKPIKKKNCRYIRDNSIMGDDTNKLEKYFLLHCC